jgi:hypothetical protein
VPIDTVALALADATDITWALAWTRHYLRDVSSTPTYSDAELTAHNTAFAFTAEDTFAYFRPHVTAASIILADPDRAMNEGVLGAYVTHRSPRAIALAIRSAGAWVDDLIEAASGERPPSGRTLTPVW